MSSIRVLKKGTDHEPVWQGLCRRCESVLEADQRDLAPIHSPKAGEGPIARVQCPECRHQVILYPVTP